MGGSISFLHFHEAYHIETGILRLVVGKEGDPLTGPRASSRAASPEGIPKNDGRGAPPGRILPPVSGYVERADPETGGAYWEVAKGAKP